MLIVLEREPFRMAPMCLKSLSLVNSDKYITVAFKDVRTKTFKLKNIKIMREMNPLYVQRALDVIAQMVKKTPQSMNTAAGEVYSDK
jgi:hypothetical protein